MQQNGARLDALSALRQADEVNARLERSALPEGYPMQAGARVAEPAHEHEPARDIEHFELSLAAVREAERHAETVTRGVRPGAPDRQPIVRGPRHVEAPEIIG